MMVCLLLLPRPPAESGVQTPVSSAKRLPIFAKLETNDEAGDGEHA